MKLLQEIRDINKNIKEISTNNTEKTDSIDAFILTLYDKRLKSLYNNIVNLEYINNMAKIDDDYINDVKSYVFDKIKNPDTVEDVIGITDYIKKHAKNTPCLSVIAKTVYMTKRGGQGPAIFKKHMDSLLKSGDISEYEPVNNTKIDTKKLHDKVLRINQAVDKGHFNNPKKFDSAMAKVMEAKQLLNSLEMIKNNKLAESTTVSGVSDTLKIFIENIIMLRIDNLLTGIGNHLSERRTDSHSKKAVLDYIGQCNLSKNDSLKLHTMLSATDSENLVLNVFSFLKNQTGAKHFLGMSGEAQSHTDFMNQVTKNMSIGPDETTLPKFSMDNIDNKLQSP